MDSELFDGCGSEVEYLIWYLDSDISPVIMPLHGMKKL